MDTAVARLLELLIERRATVATAESLTGGQLAARLTSVAGASRCYVGGVVSYATDVKTGVLGVSEDLVSQHGVISAECALAMASGVRRLLATTYALSTTGVAGPDPQEGHPPGTVFVGVSAPEGELAFPLLLDGDRAAIQSATCDTAVESLLGVLLREHGGLG